MQEVIDSYLVSLGFSTDNASFNKAQRQVKAFGKTVTEQTIAWQKGLLAVAKVTAAATAAISAASLAMVKMSLNVADADLGYKKFALRMYMTEGAARRLKMVTDAMGESMEDIAWIPELHERYVRLMKTVSALEDPRNAETFKQLRGLKEEYTRFKLEMTSGWQHLVARVAEKMGIKDMKLWLSNLNDTITKNIPKWAREAAEALARLMAVFRDIGDSVRSFIQWLEKLWDLLGIGSGILKAIEKIWDYITGSSLTADLAPVWREFKKALEAIVGLIGAMIKGLDEFASKYVGDNILEKFFLALRIVLRSCADAIATLLRGIGAVATGLAKIRHPKEALQAAKDYFQAGEPQAEKEREVTKNLEKTLVMPDHITGVPDEAIRIAKQLAADTGQPADFFLGQIAHETNQFKDYKGVKFHNWAGIRDKDTGKYKQFKDEKGFENFYEHKVRATRSPEFLNAKTDEERVHALKMHGYMEDSEGNYYGGVERQKGWLANQMAKDARNAGVVPTALAQAAAPNVTTNNNVNITVHAEGADPHKVGDAVHGAVKKLPAAKVSMTYAQAGVQK